MDIFVIKIKILNRVFIFCKKISYAKLENQQSGNRIAQSSSSTLTTNSKKEGKDVADWMRTKVVGQPRTVADFV